MRLQSYDRVMGLNGRNHLISQHNPATAIRLVNDKHATKQALAAVGAPAAPTVQLITSRKQLRGREWVAGMPDQWAVKPNQSLAGAGILLATQRDGEDGWRTASGRHLSTVRVRDHIRLILDGEFSPRGRDAALIEPLIISHPDLDRISYRGLPDVRVICVGEEPVLAMLRLPTAASGGRANLHQRAIGASVDLETGLVDRAWRRGEQVVHHPDTGQQLVGATVPRWCEVLDAARACAAATGLVYLGADIVVDRDRGPLVLEVNARPGLQIQNVTGRGLLDVVEPGGA